MGPWSRALTLVLGFFQISLYLGVAMFCVGVALVALTGGAHYSFVILGTGVLRRPGFDGDSFCRVCRVGVVRLAGSGGPAGRRPRPPQLGQASLDRRPDHPHPVEECAPLDAFGEPYRIFAARRRRLVPGVW
jgi:hypothetical protein